MLYRDDYWTDLPDRAEIAAIEAETNAAQNARIRAANKRFAQNPEQATARWVKATQENIERGWGPLPF